MSTEPKRNCLELFSVFMSPPLFSILHGRQELGYVDEAAIDGLKFSACLPIELATEMLELRLQEPEATRRVLAEHVRFLSRTEQRR